MFMFLFLFCFVLSLTFSSKTKLAEVLDTHALDCILQKRIMCLVQTLCCLAKNLSNSFIGIFFSQNVY